MIKEIFLQISSYLKLTEQIKFSLTNKYHYNLIKNKFRNSRFVCYCWITGNHSIHKTYNEAFSKIKDGLDTYMLNLLDKVFIVSHHKKKNCHAQYIFFTDRLGFMNFFHIHHILSGNPRLTKKMEAWNT